MTHTNPGTHTHGRAAAGAHAHIHAGASFLDMPARVNTPGEPRATGTYWNDDDQAAATLEVLNSMSGQVALRRLDIGEGRAPMENLLTANHYQHSDARARRNRVGSPDQLVKTHPRRVVAGS